MSSTRSLTSQLREDYLTCSICFNNFTKPKALPCLHTFCEDCLRDYIVSRGFETLGHFPCPFCRENTTMPEDGVQGFPDNHVMTSLSDTVDKAQANRPKPKPRRSLGVPQIQPESDEKALPSYNTVADTNPEIANGALSKVCSNDSELDWMIVPKPTPSAPVPDGDTDKKSNDADNLGDYCVVPMSYPNFGPHMSNVSNRPGNDQLEIGQPQSSLGHPVKPIQPPPYQFYPHVAYPSQPVCPLLPGQPGNTSSEGASIGWNLNILSNSTPSGPENNTQGNTFNAHDSKGSQPKRNLPSRSSPIYPTVPTQTEHPNVSCTENLILRFGKQGSSIRDFLKPVGLAVSKEGNYIVSDSSGDQNRVFVFNSGGELINAFTCGCKVKDVTVTKNNEIFAVVHKNVSAIRHFTMSGQFKGEYGKFFTFEEPCGIGELTNGGIALTGAQNHCVYVLTNKMKLSVKFGRKGNGDGYFQCPAYIAVDSKNHIVVTDKINNCVQIFNSEGNFKLRFGTTGKNHGQLQTPLGLCVDDNDNIIIADSGNCRVEVFSTRGRWLSSVVANTHKLGDNVKPVNVAFTPTGKIAVLLRGPYFAEVRIYTSHHKQIAQKEAPVSTSAVWFS